ncbi:ABC transporter permease [Bifidobacterium stellenboschense]|uniref:Uncharacterized protein n=1 Tax=Bifidobacterium stellenboschense TaxID=762211 RepID=A0A087DPM6_9BIFI|nr:ABC transporter permease [Bifidobacterium stellenboschense]KFI97476.1 hypothetical protein BSTEL_0197 [Bifidobacterium stellenboschense]
MPWWIWLLLALFMFAMIVIGGIYAFRRAMAALRVVSDTGEQVSDRLAAMGEPAEDSAEDDSPIFTQPLRVAAERYEHAHIEVVKRRQATRDRHVQAWKRWKDAL